MKILFCNITWLKNYTGITSEDKTHAGGAWVKENEDAHEQWNFLNYDGFCYGFVMNPGEQFHIERIDKKAARKNELEDVTVVWCALNEDIGETVVVGWYEHATVYRYYQDSVCSPITGLDRCYFAKAKAEDCYLIPEKFRMFKVGRASEDGAGKGFGQQNYWYAESAYAREELIPAVEEYIESHRADRVNILTAAFAQPYNYDVPLTAEEHALAEEYRNNGEYFNFLPYGYRNYNATKSADDAYFVADALCQLYQHREAMKWYNTVVEIEGKNWDNYSNFPYMFSQIEKYDESIAAALELLDYEQAKDANVRHEIYSVISDNLYFLGKPAEAIVWLDKILAESKDKGLIEHTENVKKFYASLI